jgi:ATP-dependent helicase HrpB
VARRRAGNDLLLAVGGSAKLTRQSLVRDAPFLVAVDIEERSDSAGPLVRLASAVEPEWLLDLFPDRISERASVEWNRTAERVESVSAMLYDSLVIEESRGGSPDPGEAARLLAEKALDAGLQRFTDSEEVDRYLARVAFASQHSDIRAFREEDVRQALTGLCLGLRSFAELESAAAKGGLIRALEERLPASARRMLDEVAPARIALPSGRQARIEYSPHQPPSVASRLQDFFGLRETPKVARGRVPLVLHLLAPNQRPVQMTADLPGFWERLYPRVRRELSRRYPKHSWPENPV